MSLAFVSLLQLVCTKYLGLKRSNLGSHVRDKIDGLIEPEEQLNSRLDTSMDNI